MKEELENKLAEKFTFMKKRKSIDEQKANGGIIDNLYSAFGCECSDGWFDLLYLLCEEIDSAYKKANMPPDIVIMQIKEKFGTLRFYFKFEGSEQEIYAFDFLSGGGFRFMQKDTPIHKEISDIVRKYEKKSASVCERCGAAGRLRTERRWVITLCDKCNNERMSN